MTKKTRTYNETVEVLSENRPSSMTGVTPRDSDTELFIQILQLHHDMRLDKRQLEIIRKVNFGSVARCRRKLQEGGKESGQFLPSEAVGRKRRLKGFIVQQTAPSTDANGITKRIEEKA